MVFFSMSNGINHYVRKPSTYFLTSFLPHFLHFSLSFFPLSFASFPSLPSLKSPCPLPLSFCLSHSFFLPFIHSSNIYLVVYQVFPWVIVAVIWSQITHFLRFLWLNLSTRPHGRQFSGWFLVEISFRVSARQEWCLHPPCLLACRKIESQPLIGMQLC